MSVSKSDLMSMEISMGFVLKLRVCSVVIFLVFEEIVLYIVFSVLKIVLIVMSVLIR